MANSSLTISFSTQADGTDDDGNDLFIDIELDDALNGDKSNFPFGAEVFLRVFTNCTTLNFYPSEGSVETGTNGDADVSEIITFTQPPASTEDNTASLSYPATGDFTATKLGSGEGSGSVSVSETDPSTAIASLGGPGVYTASYSAAYLGKKITGPTAPAIWDSEEDYPVVIVVVGT